MMEMESPRNVMKKAKIRNRVLERAAITMATTVRKDR